MKYQEVLAGSKAECMDYAKKVVQTLQVNKLVVEGQAVRIPTDLPLEYKVKYDEDVTGGSFSLKISWDTGVEEEEEETEE
jgi:hypothetical protein